MQRALEDRDQEIIHLRQWKMQALERIQVLEREVSLLQSQKVTRKHGLLQILLPGRCMCVNRHKLIGSLDIKPFHRRRGRRSLSDSAMTPCKPRKSLPTRTVLPIPRQHRIRSPLAELSGH